MKPFLKLIMGLWLLLWASGARAQWTLVYDSNTSSDFATTHASGAAGSTLVNGWIDVKGSVWSTAGGLLSGIPSAAGSSTTDFLARPASENQTNARITAYFTAQTAAVPLLANRYQNSGTKDYYGGELVGRSTLYIIRRVAGASAVPTNIALGFTPTVGDSCSLQWTVTGTTSVTCVLVFTDITTSQSQTLSYTDGSPPSDLQGSGALGLVTNFDASSATVQFSRVQTYVQSANQVIYADDASWRNSPYNHRITGTGSGSIDAFVNPGAYKRLYVANNTSTATANFNTSNNGTTAPVVAYRWDGGAWTRFSVAATVSLSVPTGPTAKHLFELCLCAISGSQDRWTSSPPVDAVQFTGLTLDPGASVSQVPARPKNIVILGDSIKEAAFAIFPTSTFITSQDVTLSAYFALQDALNAEICLKAFSGQGFTTNLASYSNVPSLTNSYNLLWAGVSITYSPRPDLLIIDEGVNDSGSANQTTIAANIVTISNGVNPLATLIMGDQQGYQATAYNSAVSTLTAAGKKVAYATAATLVLNGTSTATIDTNEGGHPTATAHRTKLLPTVAVPAYALLYGAVAVKPGHK